MANKEFQVRHGLVVNNSVFVANVITGNVGIGTSTPSSTLQVTGNANISSNLIVTGVDIVPAINRNSATAAAAFDRANSAVTTASAAYDSSNTKLSTSGGTITGNLSIVGSLTISGNTQFQNVATLSVGDPLIYLAANNYSSDLVDIGFVGNYVNATGANVHTGLYREHTDKQYYLFQGYDKEPENNHIDPNGNNFTLAVLNADIKTSNLTLNGANAQAFIIASYNQANTAYTYSGAAFANANSTLVTASAAYAQSNAAFITAVAAFEKANTSVTDYSPAFNKANDAYVTAQSAFTQANASNTTARSAYDQANSAYVYAGAAFVNANSTLVTASAAFDKANNTLSKGYILLSNSSTVIDGTTANVWGGSFTSSLRDTYAGVYNSNNSTALFTLASGSSGVMSMQMDGSLFVGENFVSDAMGVLPSYGGWIVAASGIKTPYNIYAGNDLQSAANVVVGNYATFSDGTVQNTGYTSKVYDTANAAPGIANSYATAVGTSGNNYTNSVGTSGNAYALSTATGIGNAGNSYATAVGTSANAYATVVAGAAYAQSNSAFVTASAAYDKANASVQYSTGGTYTAGAKQNFTPNATFAGLNVGQISGNPTNNTNGDLIFNTAVNRFQGYVSGWRTVTFAELPTTFSAAMAFTNTLTANSAAIFNGNATFNLATFNARSQFANGISILGLSSDPANAANGDIWYNSTTNKLSLRQGSTNYTFATNADVTAIGTSSNSYAASVGTAGNAYAASVGTSANVYADSVVLPAFNQANTALTTAQAAYANANSSVKYNASGTFTERQVFTANNTANTAAFNITPRAANPTNLTDGDIWINSSTSRIYYRLNSGTRELMQLDAGQVVTAKKTFTASNTQLGILALTPVASLPTSGLVAGDLAIPITSNSFQFFANNSWIRLASNTEVIAAFDAANAAPGIANSYATAVGTSGNAYAATVGTGANSFTITVFNTANLALNTAQAAFATANAGGGTGPAFNQANLALSTAQSAFGKANTALQNTTGVFAGSLSVTGQMNVASDFNHTGGVFFINNSAGAGGSSEGGEIQLANSTSPTQSLSGRVSIDIYENKLRFFETSGSNRGAYIDLSIAGAGVGSNLLSGGGGTSIDQYARDTAGAAFNKANAALANTDGVIFSGSFRATANIEADRFISNNNGNGENIKIGDDIWIGDTNLANALRIKGQQNASIGYVLFGQNDGKLLGRDGAGALTYDSNTIWHAGNDGTGSGLDADLLDGQNGSYYTDIANSYAVVVGASANARANVVGTSANAFATSVGTSGNAYALSTATSVGTAGNSYATAVGTSGNAYALATATAIGTAGNSYTTAVGTSGNAYATSVGTSSNAYATAVGTSGNTYAASIGVGANSYAATVGTSANAYAVTIGASANGWANTKLSASGGTITGDLSIVGSLYITGNSQFQNVTTLSIGDPLIYLAANNYVSDTVDIGFIANYVNATGANVHTGLYREHVDKMYYLFQGYDQEPINNHIGALSNNMSLAVLNADIRTSNLVLFGANAQQFIISAFAQSNSAFITASAAFDKANATTYTSNVVISVADNSNAALRITQTGTGEAIRVEDSANPDATSFVVDANGNVGIGTSNSSYKLDVAGTINSAGIIINGVLRTGTDASNTVIANSALTSGINAQRSLNLIGTDSVVKIVRVSDVNNPAIELQMRGTAGNISSYFDIYTGTANNISIRDRNGANRDRLSIDGTGNVGIGITSPTYKLDVTGTVNASAIFVNGVEVTSIANSYATAVGTSGNAYAVTVGTSGNAYATAVGTAGNTYATSVGAAANVYAASVGVSANTYADTKLANTTGTVFNGTLTISNQLDIYGNTDIGVSNLGSNTTYRTLTVSSNGFSVIKVRGDASNLTGEGGGAAVAVYVDGGSVTPTGILSAIQSAGQRGDGGSFTGTLDNSMLVGSAQARPMHFGTNNTVRMTMDVAGNVGIGTSAPTYALDINGTVNAAAVLVNGAPITGGGGGAYSGDNGEASGTGLGDIFRVHKNILSANVTIYSGNNSVAVGPLTIATGKTLTIQPNARSVIV